MKAQQSLSFASKFCPCGFEGWELTVFSADWHRAHKTHHLAIFPEIAKDAGTVRNLDDFVVWAERRAVAS